MNIAKPPMNIAKPPDKPFLIVISYWEGDRDMCREMVRLLVDLQEKHAGKAAKILLICRQDSKIDAEMVRLLKSKFDLETKIGTSPLRGYPGGANGLFASAALHLATCTEQYDGWFWMEPDCVPMYPNWWVDLKMEWKNRPRGVQIMGWKGDCNGNGTGWHITGCAIYDQQIARTIPCLTMCDGIPWDYKCRDEMLRVGKETLKIHLCWRAKNATPDILKNRWSIAHGYKDGSLLKLVRKEYVKI